jgi:hypothetical protein
VLWALVMVRVRSSRERVGVPAEGREGGGEVAQAEADGGVVGSVGVLGDAQGPLLQGSATVTSWP